MKSALITILKIILVVPAALAGYGLFNLLGFLFAWIGQWMGNNISLWSATQSDVDLLQFLTASDFAGAGYFGGVWNLFLIRFPGTTAFFMIPVLMFGNHPKSAFWSFVVLFIIVSITFAVIASTVIDKFQMDEIIRGVIEILVIPIIAILYVHSAIIKEEI
jgi:hypothetical protein